MQPSDYKQHPLWAAVDGLGTALVDTPEPDGHDLHEIERIRAVHDELDQRRELNPYLMDENLLDQAQTGTEAVRTAMTAYVGRPRGQRRAARHRRCPDDANPDLRPDVAAASRRHRDEGDEGSCVAVPHDGGRDARCAPRARRRARCSSR